MRKLAVVIGFVFVLCASVSNVSVLAAGPLIASSAVSGSIMHVIPASVSAEACPSYSQNCIVVPPTGEFSFI